MTQARDLADGKFDTNTLVVDATNNRVGIGTVSPSQTLEISNDGNAGLDIVDSGSGDPAIRLSVANSAGYVGTTTNHSLRFISNDSEVGRFLSGGGLTFNGDTATANALDDYEEGSFTPTLTFGGGSTGMTFSAQNGRYTKIGNMCTVYVEMNLSNKGSSTGSVVYGGLPFTAAGDIQDRAVALQMFRSVPSGSNNLANLYHVFPQNNQSGCILRSTISTGDSQPSDGTYDNDTRISYTLTYKTA